MTADEILAITIHEFTEQDYVFKYLINNIAILDYDYITPCWCWQGNLRGKGYGMCNLHGRFHQKPIHRVAFILWKHPIEEGNQIHHLCRTKSCINPDHLEEMTVQQHHILHGEGNEP